MLPIEVVVRGYITGSGWKDYQATGEVSGHRLPEGLSESEQLPEPIFTPSTKATEGHDENITRDQAAEVVGAEQLADVERVAIELYRFAAEHAAGRGIIIADTKFEFGLDDAESLGWDKTAPGPELPDAVVTGTRARYVEAFERLTEITFDDYAADPGVVSR
jgi:phosphoribosylaminoimidazole-succinocarboxamide synthase